MLKTIIGHFNINKYPQGSITQFFGENQELYARWGLKGHNGIDIYEYYGAPLYAFEGCKVVEVKLDPSGFGKHVRLRSVQMYDGCYREWVYGHMSNIHVIVGEYVEAGDQIGLMGNTGFVVSGGQEWWGGNNPDNRGTHCHLGLRYLIPDENGWSYSGDYGLVTYNVRNYDNGYKGAVDPLTVISNKHLSTQRDKMFEIIRILNIVIGLYNKIIKK